MLTLWWMISWLVFPATLVVAVIIALLRGRFPDRRAALREGAAIGILLPFCLIPRLVAAPQVRPYPSAGDVLWSFAGFTALGLAAAGLAYGAGALLRRLSLQRK